MGDEKKMTTHVWRLYLDASVLGGCFDPEFEEYSRRVMDAVFAGKVCLLYSEVLEAELQNAPEPVRHLFIEVPDTVREKMVFSSEVKELAREYVARGVVAETHIDDCRHVAAATIVSWNFHHIVKLDKIKGYNQVNLLNGYGVLTILSPKEVSFDD